MLYRSEGYLHCPLCFCMREFVPAFDATNSEAYPPIECSVCGYEFRDSKDEVTKTARPTVSAELREDARKALREELAQHLLRSGVRKEALIRRG